jgi:hypothetical protein
MSPQKNGFVLMAKICLISAVLYLRSPIAIDPVSSPQSASIVQSTWPLPLCAVNGSRIYDTRESESIWTGNGISLVYRLIFISLLQLLTTKYRSLSIFRIFRLFKYELARTLSLPRR